MVTVTPVQLYKLTTLVYPRSRRIWTAFKLGIRSPTSRSSPVPVYTLLTPEKPLPLNPVEQNFYAVIISNVIFCQAFHKLSSFKPSRKPKIARQAQLDAKW